MFDVERAVRLVEGWLLSGLSVEQVFRRLREDRLTQEEANMIFDKAVQNIPANVRLIGEDE